MSGFIEFQIIIDILKYCTFIGAKIPKFQIVTKHSFKNAGRENMSISVIYLLSTMATTDNNKCTLRPYVVVTDISIKFKHCEADAELIKPARKRQFFRLAL